MNRAHIELSASAGDAFATVLMDVEDYLRLEGRALSIGSHGYPQLWADQKVQTLHRWIFGLTGSGFTQIVDHINRNQLDNRRSNLRITDGSISNLNRHPADNPYAGVFPTRSGRWVAKYQWRARNYYLGTFDDRDVAANAIAAHRAVHVPEIDRERLAIKGRAA